MRHFVAVAVAIYLLSMLGVVGMVGLAFPSPPGTPCATPNGPGIFPYLETGAGAEGFLFVTGTDINDTQGVVNYGCTVYQDSLLLLVSGSYSNYSVVISQQVGATGYENQTVPVPAVPGAWTFVNVKMLPASSIQPVSITLYSGGRSGNVTGVSWHFFHLTPAAALVDTRTTAGLWEFGVAIFIAGVATSFIAYRMAEWTVARMGFRSKSMKKAIAVLAVSDLILLAAAFLDWPGIMWHLGQVATFGLILLPTFVNMWILSLRRGRTKLGLALRFLPDVLGEFSHRRRKDRDQERGGSPLTPGEM